MGWAYACFWVKCVVPVESRHRVYKKAQRTERLQDSVERAKKGNQGLIVAMEPGYDGK
jgi:hypothetical protein